MRIFTPIPEAIEELKKGNMLIVVDSPNRENQGDIIFPAETVTGEKVNFLIKKCGGMVCVAITKQQVARLHLPLMVAPIDNTETTNVQFTVSVDANDVTSFGISASDRAKTITVLSNPTAKPNDIVRPGHIFPLLSHDGGILERAGHTEATVELSRFAGFTPCGVLCEILTDEGEVARLPDLLAFSKKYHIPIISIPDLITYVKKNQRSSLSGPTIAQTASSVLPTEYGTFQMTVYTSIIDNREHIAMQMGNGTNGKPILTRIHSQCLTGDTLLSLKCDCRQQLHTSMRIIKENGSGIIIYLNQEGRGIGLTNKIKAYALQQDGLDTVEANMALHLPIDARNYAVAAEILHHLGISTIHLLTNNPMKWKQLKKYGIRVVKKKRLEVPANAMNARYLQTKKQKLGHLLSSV